MIGYKVTLKNGTSAYGNKQRYEVGQTYKVKGTLVISKNGLHFCKFLISCGNTYEFFDYPTRFKYFKVKATRNIISEDDTYCTNKLEILEEIYVKNINDIVNFQWREVVKQDGYTSGYNHYRIKQKEFFLNLPLDIKYDKLTTKEKCMEEVKKDGRALKCIPSRIIDKEICIEALKQNGNALKYIQYQYELIDNELCLTAIKQDGDSFRYIPSFLRDKEKFLELIKQDGCSIHYVTAGIIDREMCLVAVRQNGCALYDIPDKLKDEEICAEAVKQNIDALQYVPDGLRSTIKELMKL